MDYLSYIPAIAARDATEVIRKDIEYGASWKRRGGPGAFMVGVRKFDRLETQAGKFNWDIFEAILQTRDNGEPIIETIRDARGYLLLWEAEMVARGVLPVPSGEGVPRVLAVVKSESRPEVEGMARLLERLLREAGTDRHSELLIEPATPNANTTLAMGEVSKILGALNKQADMYRQGEVEPDNAAAIHHTLRAIGFLTGLLLRLGALHPLEAA